MPREAKSELPRRSHSRWYDALALLVMILAVLWVYCPLGLLTSNDVLAHGDFLSLHQRRIEFAQVAMFGPAPHIPAWYPREMLGTPFWANLQNFPLIPTRFPLLLMEPWHAYAIGVNLGAVLSALFTFLLCRQLGTGRIGAATAGWTFACAGFFASRVLSGHLPLLEAYPALPLLLWLAERCVSRSETASGFRWNLFALAFSAGCVAVAGHPQLPAYAIGATVLYLVFRTFNRRGLVTIASMALGVLCVAFSLVPMLKLIARSTRVLDLDRPENDYVFPRWRLRSFVLPWADGWPPGAHHGTTHVPFMHGADALFLDSVCYVGLLPLVALIALIVRIGVTRKLPSRPALIIAGLGVAALIFALPWTRNVLPSGPWTIFRSPARQIYVTSFALAVATGAGVQWLVNIAMSRRRATKFTLLGAVLAPLVVVHAADLYRHTRSYIVIKPAIEIGSPVEPAEADASNRVAIDAVLVHPLNRRYDDVGVFDSILLARPYEAMIALAGWPARTNRQIIDGSELGPRALAWAGAHDVITLRENVPGLEFVERGGGLVRYKVPAPLPRAGFVPMHNAKYMTDHEILAVMRSGATPDPGIIFLPPAARESTTAMPASNPTPARFTRPSSDEIQVDLHAPGPGYVRILETWDTGWKATIDGKPAESLVADGFVIAVRVDPGPHVIRLNYSTPGVGLGISLSVIGAIALGLLAAVSPRFVRAETR